MHDYQLLPPGFHAIDQICGMISRGPRALGPVVDDLAQGDKTSKRLFKGLPGLNEVRGVGYLRAARRRWDDGGGFFRDRWSELFSHRGREGLAG